VWSTLGSIMSRYGDAGLVAYATSKHAILGLTRALAMELGPHGITVNCVQPGAIATGMTKALFEAETGARWIMRGVRRWDGSANRRMWPM